MQDSVIQTQKQSRKRINSESPEHNVRYDGIINKANNTWRERKNGRIKENGAASNWKVLKKKKNNWTNNRPNITKAPAKYYQKTKLKQNKT